MNQSKDWARAVIDIPVSTSTDLNRVNEVLHQECDHALDNPLLGELLLDAPTVMGVERIEVDTVTLRMVARTLPGKQFEAGRQLRVLVVRALAQCRHRDGGRRQDRRSRREGPLPCFAA